MATQYLGDGDDDLDPQERAVDDRERSSVTDVSVAIDSSLERSTSLPRHISGGFSGLVSDLDRRRRDWTMMVRLCEQQKLHLESSEGERIRLSRALEAVLPGVRDTGRALDRTMETTKGGDVSANLSQLFTENLRALEELEHLAQSLTANLLWTRSNWEQYARSVIGAQKMRDELKS